MEGTMGKLLTGILISSLLFGCGLNSQNLRKEDTTRTYKTPYEEIFMKGMEICHEMGMTIENVDKDLGFITAKSSTSIWTNAGQTVSIQFRKLNDDEVQVSVSATMNQLSGASIPQVIGWGESSKFVKEVISRFDQLLSVLPWSNFPRIS